MTDQQHLDRINALTRNAKSTWIVLLVVLGFVGITLMRIEHIDFFGVERATTLPIINATVPTRYFFIASPILIAAIYGYFHLYLIRLWIALGAAPARLDGIRLGDAISPWLVSDAALHYRAWVRNDACVTPRNLEVSATLLNLLFTWGFGLFVLASIWWLSMPSRLFWITAFALVALAASSFIGAASLGTLVHQLSKRDQVYPINIFKTFPAMALMLVLFPTLGLTSYQRTEGTAENLIFLNLANESVVARPSGWQPYTVARNSFRAQWCARNQIDGECKSVARQSIEFQNEFALRRTAILADILRPDWHKEGRSKPDFRFADLTGSFLAGINLASAELQNARLARAQLESSNFDSANLADSDLSSAMMARTNFRDATLTRANASRAHMENAVLSKASMQQIILIDSNLEGAQLSDAELQNANMSGTSMDYAAFVRSQMQSANLSAVSALNSSFKGANMQDAILIGARLENTDFEAANLSRSDLSRAHLDRSNLRSAQMDDVTLADSNFTSVVFDFSLISGKRTRNVIFLRTDLSGSQNQGGMVRHANLIPAIFDTRTDFRNAFLDGTVVMTESFREQAGSPCQWISHKLDDDEFYGRWRGWIESNPSPKFNEPWEFLAPTEFRDIQSIPPEPGCAWKTRPM